MYKFPKMPAPDVYEREYQYLPWGELLALAADWTASEVPTNGFVLDYMCGTGYLLNKINSIRPDITLAGCTLEPRSYISYANMKYPNTNVIFKDAREYMPNQRPDMITCTAGIHHLIREHQSSFIKKVAGELKPGCFFLIGEEVLHEYNSETERRLRALNMCSSFTEYVINKDAPIEVIEATIDIISNDVLEAGEYKFSQQMLLKMIDPFFNITKMKVIWPKDQIEISGDILVLCQKKDIQ